MTSLRDMTNVEEGINRSDRKSSKKCVAVVLVAVVNSDKSYYESINLDFVEFAQRIVQRAVAKRAPAKRTGRVVVLPGIEAHHMEILLASATILQFLVLLVHLSEANGAIGVVLEIDVLRILSRRVQS